MKCGPKEQCVCERWDACVEYKNQPTFILPHTSHHTYTEENLLSHLPRTANTHERTTHKTQTQALAPGPRIGEGILCLEGSNWVLATASIFISLADVPVQPYAY